MNLFPNWVRRFVGPVLVATVVLAMLGGFFAQRLRQRQQLIAALEDLGAEVAGSEIVDPANVKAGADPGWLVRLAVAIHQATGVGEPQRTVRSIRAEGSRFGDEQLRFISEAKELRHLYLKGSEITDDSISGLASLQELRTVDLSCTPVTNESLQHLGQCTSLSKLTVNETEISRRAIEQFRDQRPDIYVQWSKPATPRRRQAIGRLLASGGQLLYANTASEDGGRPHTVVVKGRWGRSADRDEQVECLRQAAELPDLARLWLHGLNLTEPEIEVLSQLHQLRSLRIERLRSHGFHWLESLVSLEALDVADRVPTDQILSHACKLPQLRSVVAYGATDRGASCLAQAHQLETIWLRSSVVSDESIERWSHLDAIQILVIDSPNITNRSIGRIGGFHHLTRLELSNSQVDDEGLVHLQQLTKLRVLNLNDTNVTPAGFKHLVPLKQLEQLRWAARDTGESEYVDLLDAAMNFFWSELSSVGDDELKTMLRRYAADLSEAENLSLLGNPIDGMRPETWIGALLDSLQPVRLLRAAVPECRLQ